MTTDELTIDLATQLDAIDAESSPFVSMDGDGVFLMEESHVQRLIAEWARALAEDRFPVPQSFFGSSGGPVHSAMEVTAQGVAIIKIHGTMAIGGDLRWGVASTSEARRQIARAIDDPDVRGALFSVDSPGGMVAGNYELAGDMAKLRAAKPTVTHVSNVMASAAYWAGSQAEKVYASEMARVGGIGTYMVVPDLSKALEKAGVTLEVFKAGDFKAMGLPGTQITPEQKAEFQSHIEALNDYFVKGVAKGRGFSMAETRALADGRAHLARKAAELKLIDGVQSLPQTLAQLTKLVSSNSAGRSKSAMSDSSAAPVAATFSELKQTFPHADATFRERCLESSMTLDNARDAYAADLHAKLSASEARAEKAEAEKAAIQAELDAEKAKPKVTRPGAQAMADSGSGAATDANTGSDPVSAFEAAVAANVASGMSRDKAVNAAVKEDPDRHQAYLAGFVGRRKMAAAK